MIEMQWHGAELISAATERARTPGPVSDEEQIGYLQRGTDQIYCVLHRSRRPRIGQVLLAGPFAPSRERIYICWVRWARFLASQGLDVLRFDYRGTGESSGNVLQMDVDVWFEDVRCCARWLQEQGDGCPLVLHGLELGALLAAKAFEHGIGHALLLWSAPASARDVLRHALHLQRIQQYTIGRVADGGAVDCAKELEAGRSVVVSGSTWPSRLWKRSAEYTRPDLATAAHGADPYGGRSYRAVELDETAGPLYLSSPNARSSGRGGQLNPDLSALFQENADWICHAISTRNRGKRETSPSN